MDTGGTATASWRSDRETPSGRLPRGRYSKSKRGRINLYIYQTLRGRRCDFNLTTKGGMTYLTELSEASELTQCVRSPGLYSLDRLLLPNRECVCYVANIHPQLRGASKGMRLSI